MKYLTMGLLFIGMTALVGCKKEDQITKNLWNNGGDWNIVQYNSEWANNFYGGESGSFSESNVGAFHFEKDGNGSLTMTVDGQSFSNSFKYVNTENTFTMTTKEGPMYAEGDEREYSLTWQKNKIQLYYRESGENWWEEEIFQLEKK